MTPGTTVLPVPFSGELIGAEYDRLRELGGVHRVELPDGAYAWLVTGHDQVARALADPRLSLDKRHSAGGWSGFSLPPALDANLLNMDPPDHTRIRRLVSSAFTPQRVGALRPAVRRAADELLDAVAARGRADLVGEFCAPLSVRVISDLLGVPGDARGEFRAWTDAMLATHPPDRRAAGAAVVAMHRYVVELLDRKRHHPADDLLSALVAVEADGDRLSPDELTSLAFLILFAGYENSANLIANTVLMLLRRGDAPDRTDAPGLARAIEESLRREPPAPLAIRRFPVVDLEIDGVTVPAGDTVLLAIASANRDPEVLRAAVAGGAGNPAGQLAFGRGVHYCVGAALARVEAEEALAALARRLPGLTLDGSAGAVRWRPAFRTHGPATLPVTWPTPPAAAGS